MNSGHVAAVKGLVHVVAMDLKVSLQSPWSLHNVHLVFKVLLTSPKCTSTSDGLQGSKVQGLQTEPWLEGSDVREQGGHVEAIMGHHSVTSRVARFSSAPNGHESKLSGQPASLPRPACHGTGH